MLNLILNVELEVSTDCERMSLLGLTKRAGYLVCVTESVSATRPSGSDVASDFGTGTTGTFSQELKTSSSRRQFQDGDIITVVEVTEKWRRVRESDQEAPVTQRVTVTKTIRMRSDGTVLEENEDEVIDDMDPGTPGELNTAVDLVLGSSSSSVSFGQQESKQQDYPDEPLDEPEPVVEKAFTSAHAFKCGQKDGPVVQSYPDSLDNADGNLT